MRFVGLTVLAATFAGAINALPVIEKRGNSTASDTLGLSSMQGLNVTYSSTYNA